MKDMVAATTRSGEDELDPTRTSPDSSGHHQIRRGEARSGEDEPGSGERVRRRRSVEQSDGAWMGSVGPLMDSPGLSTGFPFFVFLFNLLRRASNRLGKGPIYRDLSTEAVLPTSVKFSVVVNLPKVLT